MLDPASVFILETEFLVYVWIGSNVAVKKQETKKLFQFTAPDKPSGDILADDYDKIEFSIKSAQEMADGAKHHSMLVVLSGNEPKLFKNQFLTWRVGDVSRGDNFVGISGLDALQIVSKSKPDCLSKMHHKFH